MWFDSEQLVCQFPFAYRQYARYCRQFANRSSGIIPGGSFLLRMLTRAQRAMGREVSAGIKVDETMIYLDLCDTRFLCVMNELTQASEERRILVDLLHAGDTFIDIGANHGSYALIASRIVGTGGLVVAFEPQARLAGLLSQSLTANGASRFIVHAVACTEREGTVDFFLPEGLSGSAGLFEGFSGRGRHQRTMVRTATLDNCIAGETITGKVFFKIDAEGSEFQAILGAKDTILRFRPPILFEINPEVRKRRDTRSLNFWTC